MREIVVKDYNEEWAKEFEKLKSVYLEHMEHLNIDVQHVGSTSVPGLAAKPIIDMDIIVDSDETKASVIDVLSELGYIHEGDMGIKGREAFKRKSNKVPYHNDTEYNFPHHLYVCTKGTVSLENHLKLREYLRSHPEAVLEYGNLKKELAIKYKYDIDSYIEAKTPLITKILSKAGIRQSDIDNITTQNKVSSQTKR